jgi:NADP-dependent 3-hydroxy acid dehydrogenase YdfG
MGITGSEVFLDQLKDGGGDILNISSVAGRTARAGNGAGDVAEVIAFVVSRPRRLAIDEILLRPAGQEL